MTLRPTEQHFPDNQWPLDHNRRKRVFDCSSIPAGQGVVHTLGAIGDPPREDFRPPLTGHHTWSDLTQSGPNRPADEPPAPGGNRELPVDPPLASNVVKDHIAAASDPGWVLHHSSGSAATFHDRAIAWDTGPPPGTPGEIWVHRVQRPALVLGSTQSDELIDIPAAAAAGWEVCRRRSGGGLVVVAPGDHVWIDFVLPRGHPLWDDDVHRAFDWVGRAWIETLSRLDIPADEPHHGPLVDRDAGRLLCFAGLGPGEITSNGSKIVGMSQRRSRSAARFQTMLLLREDRATIAPLSRGALAALFDRGGLRPSGFPPDVAVPSTRAVLDALLTVFSVDLISPT